MKYSAEHKQGLKVKEMPFKKDLKQLVIQRMIDSHYPAPEKFIILQSKINRP